MALDVKWTITRPELRFQEDSPCTFKITNTGKDPLQVCNPKTTLTMVELRVVNVKSGMERLHQVPQRSGSRAPLEFGLPPGKSLERGMMLLDIPKELAPGEYDVFAGCHYNAGVDKAESSPVRVKIRPTTPRTLVVEGVQNAVLFGAWVNLGDDPSEVVRMEFNLSRAEARDLRPVGKAGLRTLPAISLAKNPEACAHHWVAWIEGSELKSAHVHESQGTTPLRTTPIQAAELRLVAPLHTDPVPDDGSRPNGGALLWMGERDRQDSQLLSIKLTPDAATALARSPLPAPKPAWMASFVRADSKRLALIAQASGGKLSLSEIPWPGTAGSLRKLGEWKGEFVGAGITLDGENKLRGMLLLRAGPDLPLERLPFEINAKGDFAARPPEKLAPDFVGPVGRAIVRVSAEGVGAALLQDPQGPWSLFDGEKVAPLGGPFASAVSPLDIGFNDEGKPVLFSGGKDLGVRILNPDGSPLAGRH